MVNYGAFEFRWLIAAFNMVEVEEKVPHGFLVRKMIECNKLPIFGSY
jgi:hypothetical protein